jgi:hypothetical protein
MKLQNTVFALLLTLSSALACADGAGAIQVSNIDLTALTVLAQNPEALAATSINRSSGSSIKESSTNGGQQIIMSRNVICGASISPSFRGSEAGHFGRTYVYSICTPNAGFGSHPPVETLTITSDFLVNSGASTYTFKVAPVTNSSNP